MNLRNGFMLGEWEVHPLEGRIERADDRRRVQPKSMDVLLRLAEARGSVIERDELLRSVWGERAVSDEPLTRCVGELRRALGDKRGNPSFIMTVPKRGYRLLQEAVPLESNGRAGDPSAHPELTAGQKAVRFFTLKKLAFGFGALVLAAIVQIAIERAIDGTVPGGTASQVASVDSTRSIAVLPFADRSPAGDQAYMSDGIAEGVLNLLARIPGLRVISRSSSFSVRDEAVDVSEIADRFNVAYVLEGSVLSAGEAIRITTQLVDARGDSHVWSETYDLEIGDVFSVQDQIAQAVVESLEVALLGDAPTSRETNPDAYALFLQARYLHEQPAGDSFVRALDYYKAALEIDDQYVPAWVWLAALYDDTVHSLDMPAEEVVNLAFAAIDRALEIDPDDPLALGMSAILDVSWNGDYETAIAQMQKALSIDPGNLYLLRWAVIVLHGLGQHEDAVSPAEYLFARDPVGNITKINLASTYLMAGRFDDAVKLCEVQVAVNTETGPCRSLLITAYLYTGDSAGAKQQLDLMQGSRAHTRLAAMVYHSLGEADEFENALDELEKAFDEGDTAMANWIARTFAFTNDADRAFEWLDRAYSEGVIDITQNISYYAHLHSDPRWQPLMEKVGKTPEDMEGLVLKVDLPT